MPSMKSAPRNADEQPAFSGELPRPSSVIVVSVQTIDLGDL
jgi:hypothetical protein